MAKPMGKIQLVGMLMAPLLIECQTEEAEEPGDVVLYEELYKAGGMGHQSMPSNLMSAFLIIFLSPFKFSI